MSDSDKARAIPILASLNISQSVDFYVRDLGFDLIYQDASYLIVRWDEIELHFWLTDQQQFPENTACYIRGGQIETLYDLLRANEVFARGLDQPKLSSFEVRPWNMKEFYLHDPHGNLLKFGMDPAEARAT
ncbi:bleomycin resistance protein [Rhodovibrionaceae bacterium A322]